MSTTRQNKRFKRATGNSHAKQSDTTTEQSSSGAHAENSAADEDKDNLVVTTTSGQSRLHRETNPMMNSVILKHLFEFCNAYQLATYRQVCRLWHTVSMDRWRSVVAVRTTIRHRNLTEEDENEWMAVYFDSRGRPRPVPRSEIEEIRDVTTGELLRYMNVPFFKLNTKPYKNYDMRGVQENDILKRNDKKMERFWSKFGALMHELRFRGFKFDGIDTFRDIFCKYTPNLRKLNLHLSEIPEGDFDPNVDVEKQFNLKTLSVNFFSNLYRDDRLSLPWQPFLSMFPNLAELELSFLSNFAEFNAVLEAIDHIRKMNRHHLKLTKLDISRVQRDAITDFPVETARLLQGLCLPLERLDVDIGYKTSMTSMSIILKSYHKTLKWLTLFRAPFSGPFTDFPFQIQFDSLKILSMYGPFSWDFSFLRFTPNLEKLYLFLDANFISYLPIFMRIYRRNPERKVEFLDDMIASTVQRFDMSSVRLEHLNTFLGEFEIKSPESIRILARWMPNLKHLGLHLGKNTFPTVCELYPELTCLCVYGHNDVDDEAVTGVPIGVSLGSRASSRIGRQLIPATRPPNITNLKKLTSFTLSRPSNHPFECQHLTPKLTDHSVTHGFLHLPQLRFLSLSMASAVSRKNFEALKKKLRQDCITLIVSKTCNCDR